MSKKVLIIEDDKEINPLLYNVLSEAGYNPQSVFNGRDGMQQATAEQFDLVLLDLMLPYKDGEEVLRRIREYSNTSIIVISAKNKIHTKVDLLRLGADDYITKPFDVDEVLARIEVTLRRSNQANNIKSVLKYHDILIDCEAKRVTVSGNNLALTVTKYAILEQQYYL